MKTAGTSPAGWIYPAILNFLIYSFVAGLAVWAWPSYWWVTVLSWPVLAYFGHTILLAFHEASHGHLGPPRWVNEMRGINIGIVALVPLSVYRVVHGSHHAHLGEVKDEEMWPYCDPKVPRWIRVIMVWAELAIGYIVTPLIFFRAIVVNWNSISAPMRKRIVREYALILLFWGIALTVMHLQGWWTSFLACYLIPAILTGQVQSVRKYTEHLGLLGNTAETAARTIVPHTVVENAMSTTMLHVNYHSAHHQQAGLPYYALPAATNEAQIVQAGGRVYPTFWSAFYEMLPSLFDPRIGSQWLESPATAPTPRTPDMAEAASSHV